MKIRRQIEKGEEYLRMMAKMNNLIEKDLLQTNKENDEFLDSKQKKAQAPVSHSEKEMQMTI